MKLKSFLFIPIILAFISCGNDTVQRGAVGSSSGQPFELLIVVDDTGQQANIINAFTEILQADYPGLPQAEAWFNIRFINIKQLTNLHKRQSTIIFTAANTENSKSFDIISKLYGEQIINEILDHPSKFYYSARNVWAKPQLVMAFFDHTYDDLYIKLMDNGDFILEQLNHIEHLRQLETIYKTGEKISQNETFLNRYSYSFRVPVHFETRLEISKHTPKDPHKRDTLLDYLGIDHIVWLRGDTRKALSNILMYSYPYKHQNDFKIENIISKRNLIGKYFIPGPSDGSYLSTENIYPPLVKEFDLNGYYAIETRGLWKVENDFMGGPFINYTIYDPNNNRVIVLEGFVHAPETRKRDFTKRIEVILNTFYTGNVEL